MSKLGLGITKRDHKTYNPDDFPDVFMFTLSDIDTVYTGSELCAVGDVITAVTNSLSDTLYPFKQTTDASRPLYQKYSGSNDYYYAFDGTDDFLIISGVDDPTLEGNDYTIFCEYMMNTKTSEAGLGTLYGVQHQVAAGGRSGMFLRVSSSAEPLTFFTAINGTNWESATSSYKPAEGQWHKVLIKKEGVYGKIYIDGVFDNDITYSNATVNYQAATDVKTTLGSRFLIAANDKFFEGNVKQFAYGSSSLPDRDCIRLTRL